MKKIIFSLIVLIGICSLYIFRNINTQTNSFINKKNTQSPTPELVISLSPIIPEGWKTFKDTKNGYEIAHPSDWTVEESNVPPAQGGFTKYKGTKTNTNLSALEIGFDSNNPQRLTIEEYGNRRINSQGINTLKSETVILKNNLPVFKAIVPIVGEVPVNSEKMYGIYYLFQKNNNVYWAQGYTTDYNNDESFYDTMMSTISF